MELRETALPEVKLIVPARHGDARGFFAETYQRDRYAAAGVTPVFLQDNLAHNAEAGTVRGLHFQSPPMWQSKLVQALRGRVFVVAVDLRPTSARFGRHATAELNAAKGEQFFLPKGFAFGYCTLEPDCDIFYKVDEYWAPKLDRGLAWDDPGLAIVWAVDRGKAILSDKDRRHPRLKDLPRDWLPDALP